MSMNEISSLISTIGFPIAACVALAYYTYKQTLLHKEEISSLSNVIERNTIVLEKLSSKMDIYMKEQDDGK